MCIVNTFINISDDIITMESDPDNSVLLDDLPFLFDQGSMVFAVEEDVLETETVRVQMEDEDDGEYECKIRLTSAISGKYLVNMFF